MFKKEDGEIKVAESAEDFPSDLRADNFKTVPEAPVVHKLVKPVLEVADKNKPLTAADVVELAKKIEKDVRASIMASDFNPRMAGQVIRKERVPITDFSTVTLDQVYDLDFPIEAKPFMSADGLIIHLKDTNYEARWVNINPQRIGEMIGKGFTYIEPDDLHTESDAKAIAPSLDASGHYTINDVVAMKIDKATYYRALRYAHERAVGTTNSSKLHERAAKAAQTYMGNSDYRNDYATAGNEGKMKFYSPDVAI